MKRSWIFIFPYFLTGVFLLTGCHHHNSDPTPNLDECITSKSFSTGQIVPGQYIVAFSGSGSGNREHKAARVFASHGINSEKISDVIDGHVAAYVATLTSAEAESLKTDPAVQAVEPDRIISMCSCFTVIEPTRITWNVHRVGYGDGTGKTAWILDSGIDLNHPDLNVDASRSASFVSGITSPTDDNGHGTHVAGIIGAKNNSIGTLGVASGATLISMKILDRDGNGFLSTAMKALAYVRAHGKPGEAINISLALNEVSGILDQELQSLGNLGFYIAIAAGNDGKPADQYSPARTSGNNIYTVSAIDSLNRFAGFSNYGNDAVDFAAPGVRILSTYKNGQYAVISGTSMASPHVAGILLLNQGKINTDNYAVNDPDGNPDPIAHR